MTTAVPVLRTLLPFRHLRWRSEVVALIAVAGPVCGTTTWLAMQEGDPVPALLLSGLVVVAAAVLSWRVLASRIVLGSEGLRSWTPRRFDLRVAKDGVERGVLRSVHAPDGRSVIRHLFLLDGSDAAVFRMCDKWWTDEQIGAVVRHFEVPLETLPEPVHLDELRRSVPRQLHWYERHPLVARLGVVAASAAGCLAVGWLAVASV